MANYILVKNNVVKNIIEANSSYISTLTGYDHKILVTGDLVNVCINWTYNPINNEFTAPADAVLPVTRFSKLQFQLKFTFEELIAIEAAAITNPAIRVLQNQQSIAEYIDTLDTNTQAGIMYLVSVGLLTQERGLQILS